MKIAQHFSAGKGGGVDSRPVGTLEPRKFISGVPTGRKNHSGPLPPSELGGYYQAALIVGLGFRGKGLGRGIPFPTALPGDASQPVILQ